jgi:hypothetical protein
MEAILRSAGATRERFATKPGNRATNCRLQRRRAAILLLVKAFAGRIQ